MKTFHRYAIAVLSTALALLATQAFAAFLAPMRLFFCWVAVLVAAVVGGTGPALVALVLSLVGAAYIAFAPVGELSLANPQDLARLGLFAVFAGAITFAVALRRRAEARAAEADRWLATTLGSIGDAVIATDAKGRIVFMNAVAAELTGWSVEEAKNRPLADVFVAVNEESRARIETPVERVLREGTVVMLANHTALVRRDGTELPVEDSAAPIRDASGAIAGTVLVFHDVSAQRRTQNHLRASESMYRALVESAPTRQVVWTATPEGVLTWSDRWAAITGITSSRGFEAVHPADVERTEELWANALATRDAYRDEVRVRTADGRYAWFAISAVPIRESDGGVRQWVGLATDVDERKRHADETAFVNRLSELLASSLDHEQTLRNLARICVPELGDWCAIDLVREDAPYQRLAVEHADPARVQRVYDLDRRYRLPPDIDPIVKVIATGEPHLISDITDELIVAMARDDEHRDIVRALGIRSLVLVPMTARGRTLGVLNLVHGESGRRFTEADLPFIQDVARRAAMAVDNARLFEEAQAASRAKDEFLATLSHELRTPLTAISGWAGMLVMGGLDAATTRTAIETIARNAKTQGELIEELLDVSRVIAGKLHLDVTTVNLTVIAEEAVLAARPAAAARRVDLTFAPASPVALVSGDDRRLRQIVWNLVANAVKFTDAGGHVDVLLGTHGGAAQLIVRDTGRGIDPSFLPHIWERFRQADSSASRQHGGLGLGLAVVRHLAELHGGSVRATSAGLGHGSTFTVEIPLAPELTVRPEPLRPLPPVRAVLTGRRVLVVDDDADSRGVLQAILTLQGARVVAAANADQALHAIEGDAFDVVLSDLAMPHMNGYELLDRIRARSDVPVVAISAMGAVEEQKRALAAGFADFVRKPVDASELAARVLRHAPDPE